MMSDGGVQHKFHALFSRIPQQWPHAKDLKVFNHVIVDAYCDDSYRIPMLYQFKVPKHVCG